jgi:beta-xylosidase
MVSVLNSMKEEFSSAEIKYVKALDAVDATDGSKIAEAVAAAKESEVAVVVVGDRAGLFGRGTSGEGCDAEDLDLPGLQVL